jgi:hypothetical protein
MPLTDEQYEALASRYLTALARNDMRAWRKRISANEQCAEEPDRETIPEMSRLKRVVRVRRGEEA